MTTKVGKAAPKKGGVKTAPKVGAKKQSTNAAPKKQPTKSLPTKPQGAPKKGAAQNQNKNNQNNEKVGGNVKTEKPKSPKSSNQKRPAERANQDQGGKRKFRQQREERQMLDDGQPWFGRVDGWNPEKGFGFIQGDDRVDPSFVPQAAMNNGRVFCTRDDIGGISLRDLQVGMRVQYTLYCDSKGLGACNVVPAGMRQESNLPAMLQGVDRGTLRNLKAGQVVVRIRLASLFVPGLIGKGGENVKEMRKESGAQFDFDDWSPVDGVMDDPDFLPVNEWGDRRPQKAGLSVIKISGDAEAVACGLLLIALKTQEAAMSNFQRLVVIVPDALVGKVIGKKGENIKKLRGNDQLFRINVGDKPTAVISEAGDEQVTLVTLFGPSGAMLKCVENLVSFLTDEFTHDLERVMAREQNFSDGFSDRMGGRFGGGFGGGHGGFGGHGGGFQQGSGRFNDRQKGSGKGFSSNRRR